MESATFKSEILELELAQFGVTSVHFPKIQPTLAEGHGLLQFFLCMPILEILHKKYPFPVKTIFRIEVSDMCIPH